jgi:hypothetical protein
VTSPPGCEAKQGKVTLVSVIVLQCHMMCMHDDMHNPLHIGRKGRTPQDLIGEGGWGYKIAGLGEGLGQRQSQGHGYGQGQG